MGVIPTLPPSSPRPRRALRDAWPSFAVFAATLLAHMNFCTRRAGNKSCTESCTSKPTSAMTLHGRDVACSTGVALHPTTVVMPPSPNRMRKYPANGFDCVHASNSLRVPHSIPQPWSRQRSSSDTWWCMGGVPRAAGNDHLTNARHSAGVTIPENVYMSLAKGEKSDEAVESRVEVHCVEEAPRVVGQTHLLWTVIKQDSSYSHFEIHFQ